MKDLEYSMVHQNGIDKYFFVVPPSYENSTVSLILGNTLLVESKYGPSDKPIHFNWLTHPLTSKYKNLKVRIVLNFFGHNGFEETNLFYIHPPKCGGSSIEMTGYEYGVRWSKWIGNESYRHYHLPSSHFMEEKKELIKDKILFTSVRNPYDRIISSVYCPYFLITKNLTNVEISLSDFNDIIKENISTTIPVYEYVYYNDKKIIPHVLKLENLTNDFNKLMFDYNNNIRMNNVSNSSSYYYEGEKFRVSDINKNLLKDINNKFKLDFEYFDYKKIV